MSNQSDPEPVPVPPPTIDENPSATGVVDADEEAVPVDDETERQ